MDDHQKLELEEKLEELEAVRGRHTELVTVLIPASQNIHTVTKQLESEKSTAANIKSKQTRSAVTDSLERIIRELKNYKKTPDNGLALFAGNVSEKEGVQDIKLWVILPPKPLNVRMYRCDQTFVTEPLREILQTDEVYGLLTIDRQAATIAVLEGKQIKIIRKLTSGVPGKVRAGGQCLSPDTLIETLNGIKFIKDIKIGEKVKAFDTQKDKIVFASCLNKWEKTKPKYLEITTKTNKKIISSLEHTFFLNDHNRLLEIKASMLNVNIILINDKLENEAIKDICIISKKIDLVDIETEAGNFFANNILVHNSSQRFHRITEGLAKDFFRRVAEHMKEIFFDMPRLKGILVGGPIPTKEEFLEEGQLVTKLKEKVIAVKDIGYVDEHGIDLLVESSHEEIAEQEIIKEKKIVEKFFETLGKDPKRAVYGEEKVNLALERGAVDKLLIYQKLDKHKIAELEKKALNIGAEAILISDETEEGIQFYNITKGAGAILRFALE